MGASEIDRQKHHYVPQFYLRHWGIPKKRRQIWAHDIETNKVYLTSIRNVAQEKGFYKVAEEDSLEEELAKIEAQIAPTWSKMAKIKSLRDLTEEERIHVALFVCTTTVRNIEMREEITDISKLALQRFQEGNLEIGENLRNQLDISKESATKVMVSLVRHQKEIVPIMLRLKWMLATPPPGYKFPTSDNPVVKHNDIPGGSLGLLSPGVQIYLPISSERLIVMVDPNDIASPFLPELFAYDKDNLTHLISLLVSYCSRFLFSQDGKIALLQNMKRRSQRIQIVSP